MILKKKGKDYLTVNTTAIKLRYIVEGKFAASFTVTKKVLNEQDADKKVFQLKLANGREGRIVNSGFILYNDNNQIIHRY